MNSKYEALFQPITLGNGVQVANRFAMAPMLVFASNEDDSLGEWDEKYFSLRNDTGGIIISGAATVSKNGHGMPQQLTIYDDAKVEGLTRLAKIMKAKGNKAIVQLHHAGRESVATYQECGKVYGPSAMHFPWMDYPTEELSNEEILQIIDDYGEATRRAIEAGFDGVEVHGANHYLLQQFFSAYSNRREDEWGGTFEKRMAFPLAVLKRVKDVVKEKGSPEFIVGYRISPEEVHGENVGYTVDDAVKLIDKVIEGGADYIHVSTFDYKGMPAAGGKGEPITKTIYDSVNHRVPVIVAGDVLTADKALDCLNYADIAGLARAVIIDPDFVPKIREGREDEIYHDVTGRVDKLNLSPVLVGFWQMEGTPLPPLKGMNC